MDNRIQEESSSVVQNSYYDGDLTIRLRRILVEPQFNFLVPDIPEEVWEQQLNILNQLFSSQKIHFSYLGDPVIIKSLEFYDFNPTDASDMALFENNLPGVLNVYFVKRISYLQDGKEETPAGQATGGIPYFTTEGVSDNGLRNDLLLTYSNVLDCKGKFIFSHEIGHILGLLHTFETRFGGREQVDGRNSSFAGDHIGDTKANRQEIQSIQKDDIKCGDVYVSNVGLTDCNGLEYNPDLWNVMGYFDDATSKIFTQEQLKRMRKVLIKYRGDLVFPTWARITSNTYFQSSSNNLCGDGDIIELSVIQERNVSTYKWKVEGATIVGATDARRVLIKIDKPGKVNYSLRVTNADGSFDFETEVESLYFGIGEGVDVVKCVPFTNNFDRENFLLSGWHIENLFMDCSTFDFVKVSKDGRSQLCLRKISNTNASTDGNLDVIYSPIFSISNLKSAHLTFKYAYSNGIRYGDTLRVYAWKCGKWEQLLEVGGQEMQTSLFPSGTSTFVPNDRDWRQSIVSLLILLNQPLNSRSQIAFQFKSGGGAGFFIDDIEIIGESTKGLELAFDRATAKTTLIWPDFIQDKTGYQIQRSPLLESNWQAVGTVEANVLTWSEIATSPVIKFRYRILPITETGTPYSNEVIIDTIVKPIRPKMLQTIVADRNVGIKWNDPNEYESNYDLYYSYSKGAPMILIDSFDANTSEYLHRKLPANTKVYYMVRARELNFVSDPSDTIEALVNVYPVQSRISKVEGYFDEPDPGPGNGIALKTTGSSEEIVADGLLPVDQLTNGIHVLYLRARDNKGYWSNIQSSTFLKLTRPDGAPAIAKLEYALNATANPTWIPVDIGPGIVASEGLTVTIDAPVAALLDGIHFVTVRAQDNQGHWGNYFHQSFLKITGPAGEKKVITLEYKIDKGLIIGSGTAVSLTPGTYVNASIDLPPLPNGKHYISIAAKDNGGYYSNIAMDSFVVRDQSFCEKNATVFYRSPINNARSYFWQVNDGSGWKTIVDNDLYTGSRTQVLRLNSPPTNWYGYQYRSIANGVIEEPFTLKFSDTWTGSENDDWHNPANWCCFGVPDEYTDVIIDPSTTRKPKISASSICRSLTLKPGALLKIEDGQTLDIKGQ